MKKTTYVKLTHGELDLLKEAYKKLTFLNTSEANRLLKKLPITLQEKLRAVRSKTHPYKSVAEVVEESLRFYPHGYWNSYDPSYPLKCLIDEAETK